MRKVKTIEQGNQKAVILFDREWNEYRTQYFVDGEYLGEACDNHTDEKDDAIATAQAELARGMTKPEPSELVKSFDAELLSDIADSAIDSVQSWADVSDVTRKDGAVISFRMTDSEDSDVSKLVTLETIAKGLRAILDNAESCCEEIRTSVQQAAQEKDACYLDAWGFDAIAQIGAFGEIVYG